MTSNMSVVFLGTSSGGGPSESRNCSSLVCDMFHDNMLWMVDCAEGTTRQFALQQRFAAVIPHLRIQKISKIFITHMHADHVMGVVPLLRNLLFPPPTGSTASVFQKRTVEVYGPAGLRTFIRLNMKMTLTGTADTYKVHELLTAEDPVTPCEPASSSTMNVADFNVMHCSELAGLNFRVEEDGLWHAIAQGRGRTSNIVVDAGPILHRDPCIGYVFTETYFPQRKLVILGDTDDPSAMLPLCLNPSPSLLIHEATDSHISRHADPSGQLSRRTPADVRAKALSRGHSTPEMAGAFAKRIGARALVLNHIGGRFPAPRHPKDFARQKIIRDIEKNASDAWGSGKQVTAAYDYLRVEISFDDGAANADPSMGAQSSGATNRNRRGRPQEAGSGDLDQEEELQQQVVEAVEVFRAGGSSMVNRQVEHQHHAGSSSGENHRGRGQGNGRKRRRGEEKRR